MPRKPRPIHTERAYHVFNRGNYRLPVFETEGAREAFLEVAGEAARRFGWVVYAYALMPNHYHLCLRTPRGNLSEGMHWLLTTFAARFNGFREESGHVFQGRFKCTVASEGLSARRIIDYIHLNPARAGLGEIGSERSLGLTSLGACIDPGRRGLLAIGTAMEQFLGFPDTPEGRLAYIESLKGELRADPRGTEFETDEESAWKAEARMRRKSAGAIPGEMAKSRETAKSTEMQRWGAAVVELLVEHGLQEEQLSSLAKSHPAKLAIARKLRDRLGAEAAWIAARLHAGTGASLRARLSKTQ